VSTNGVLAPAATPKAIVTRLNREIIRALNQTEIREKFHKAGSELIGSSPEHCAPTIRRELAKWTAVIQSAGIRPD
jgi:tripartite-type tricarboxylate transporter receptor subunit TctC